MSVGAVRPLAGLALTTAGVGIAQVSPAGSPVVDGWWVGVAFILSGLATSVGTAFFIPYLKEKGTQQKLAAAEQRLAALEKDMARVMEECDATAEREKALVRQLLDQTEKIASLTEANLLLIHNMLILAGRQRQTVAPRSSELLIVQDASPTDTTPKPGPRVLIVDDDPQVRDALSRLLRLRGCVVGTAEDLAEAVAALDDRPDFVLLDLMLPGGSGLDLLRAVRERDLASRVIVTSGAGDDEIDRARSLGPFAVFRKPVDYYAQVLPLIQPPA